MAQLIGTSIILVIIIYIIGAVIAAISIWIFVLFVKFMIYENWKMKNDYSFQNRKRWGHK